MNGVLTAALAVLVFGFLIFIHEFGHYIFARIFKVTINDFSIGMGPRLFSWRSKKTGIRYAISAFPIGGYVAMAGEERDEIDGSRDTADILSSPEDDPNTFDKKPAWQRFIITFAGAFINIIAGFLAMIIVVGSTARPSTVVGRFLGDEEKIKYGVDVMSDSALMVGDEIVAVDGRRVYIYESMRYEVMRKGEEPIDLTVIRNGETVELYDVQFPKVSSEGQTFGSLDFLVYEEEKTFFSVIGDAWCNLWLNVRMVWESLYDLITGRYTIAALSGPVGISSAIGEAAEVGIISLINLVAIISINLGVMNLLPIPALDGGRLITIVIEMITGKKLPAKVENTINAIGLALLLTLSVFVLVKDVVQLIL
ncbi:MAG: site-2 protease family protein [Clostridia bacterium]|nr:site-2 protease family protein [Clostridia bacterium]